MLNKKLLAVAFAGVCAFLDMYATQPLLPLLEDQFHTSKMAVSLTVSATTFAVALAAPIVGIFADAIGRKRIIVGAILALALPTFLACRAETLHQLIFWRFLQGLLMPAVFAVTIAYVSEEWSAKDLGTATSAYVTGTVVGGFTGRVLSGIATAYGGWHMAFIALGCLNVAGGVATWSWLPRSRKFVRSRDAGSSLRAIGSHLRNPRLLTTYALGFCVLFSLVGTFTYVTFHLAAAPYRLSEMALGSIFFVYLLGVVVTPMGGKWIDRFGFRPGLIAALLCSIGGVLMTLCSPLWLIVLGLAVCSSGVFVAQVAANGYIGRVAGVGRASAVGLYVSCYYIGGGAAAAVLGYAWAIGGWPACVATVVGVQLVTIGFVSRFWGKE